MSEALTKALSDHGQAIEEFKSEMLETQSEFRQRMLELEQAVTKGIQNAGNGHSRQSPVNVKSIMENPAFEQIRQNVKGSESQFGLGEISLKALFNDVGEPDTANGTMPSRPDQIGGYHGYVLRPLRLLDVLGSSPQRSNSFDYVRLAFTGDAEMQEGEGAEKAEMDFEGSLVAGRVETVAVHTTTSAQVLDDNDALEAEINRILFHKVRSKIEEQVLVGSGTGHNLEGLYTASTDISTPGGPNPDRLGYAATQMETLGYQPGAFMMNPLDWFAISILKDADGNYIYGNPASPAPPTLWNRPVITTPTLPQGTALVGDLSKAEIRDRMQPTVFISRDHKDYRTRNLVLILVEARLGLAIYDEGGFRKVDLSPTSD